MRLTHSEQQFWLMAKSSTNLSVGDRVRFAPCTKAKDWWPEVHWGTDGFCKGTTEPQLWWMGAWVWLSPPITLVHATTLPWLFYGNKSMETHQHDIQSRSKQDNGKCRVWSRLRTLVTLNVGIRPISVMECFFFHGDGTKGDLMPWI